MWSEGETMYISIQNFEDVRIFYTFWNSYLMLTQALFNQIYFPCNIVK